MPGLVILIAALFVLLLWAIGRVVIAVGEKAPRSLSQRRQYLAGRLNGVRVTALVDGGDEVLVLTRVAHAREAPSGPLAQVFRVTARECSLARVRRWQGEGTLLRAYLSQDGAVMLADPVLGGNAACEPFAIMPWHASEPAASQQETPADDK